MAEIITSEIEIQSGVTSSGLTVEMGGVVTVLSGGIVTDAEAVNYGWFWVEEGGHISNIHLTHSGDAMVDGGLAENLTMESGGQADIFGGTMRTGTILNGGYGAIYETGSGLDVAVSAGGRYLVYGGYAENTIISSGGSFTVQLNSGLASRTTILTGGSARVVSAGEMRETTLNGGNLQVLSGAVSLTQIQSGGSLFVDAAGEAFDTTLNDGGILDVLSGTIYDTLAAGGKVDLKKAVAFSITVNGGTVFADSDSIITAGVLLNKGGTLSVRSGTLVTGCEFRGGTALIERGAVFSSSIVRSGGDVTAQDGEIYRTVAIDQMAKMYVQSGASVSDVIAVKDAELIVQSEGVVSGADVVGGVVTLTGGTALDVSLGKTTLPFSRGMFSTPSVVSYGNARLVADRTAALRISSGGLAVGAYASEGNAGYGSEYVGIYVGDGGVVSNTTIDKAVLYVSSGGVARDTKISGYYEAPIGGYVLTRYPSYGKIYVLSGGYAENIDMNQAILKISGGTVRNLVASNWSVIDLSEGGVIGGALELTGSAKLTLGSNGGTIDFDISETAPGAAAVKKGLSLIEGAPLSRARRKRASTTWRRIRRRSQARSRSAART